MRLPAEVVRSQSGPFVAHINKLPGLAVLSKDSGRSMKPGQGVSGQGQGPASSLSCQITPRSRQEAEMLIVMGRCARMDGIARCTAQRWPPYATWRAGG